MGNTCGCKEEDADQQNFDLEKFDTGVGVWRHELTIDEARKCFEADGTVPKGCSDEMLELRMYISDPSLLRGLVSCARSATGGSHGNVALLRRWVEFMSFKYVDKGAIDLKISTGYDLYIKYLDKCAGSRRIILDPTVLENIENELKDAVMFNDKYIAGTTMNTTDMGIIRSSLFDEIYFSDMEMILSRIYVPFKESPEYDNTVSKFKTQYNQISVQDFEYMEALGHGGFGCVVHCKKKSTGIHYAMKIQTKDGAIKHSHGDFAKVTIEKDALVLCNHPFITNLVYSFQNEQLTMMVMSLAGGSLAELADEFPGSILPEEHVIFYAAEILLALNHVHRLGMIYRDMKPANVLVMGDGHVKLADLGGVVDVGNVVAGYHTQAQDGIFAASDVEVREGEISQSMANRSRSVDGSSLASNSNVSGTEGRHSYNVENEKVYTMAAAPTSNGVRKAYSYFGTAGYVAPEVLRTIVKPEDGSARSKEGYTHAVDFFSLGVSMYQLLTAQLPFEFRTNNVERFECSFNYRPFPQKEDGSYTASAECRELLERLLVGEEKTRLGYGRSGFSKIRKHSVFKNMSWILLAQKKIRPPELPERLMENMDDGGHMCHNVDDREQFKKFDGFYHMLIALGHTGWVTKSLMTAEEQVHFRSWDYVSGDALGQEIMQAQGREAAEWDSHKPNSTNQSPISRFLGGPKSWFSPSFSDAVAPDPSHDSANGNIRSLNMGELEASSYISSVHMVDAAANVLRTLEADEMHSRNGVVDDD